MDTLYLTDLDGTLLTPQAEVSPESAATLNRLIAQGMQFSVATARSPATAAPLLSDIALSLPAILMNGVFLYDFTKQKVLEYCAMQEDALRLAIRAFEQAGQCPFFYQLDGDAIRASFTALRLDIQRDFYETRRGRAYKHFEQVERLEPDARYPGIYLTLIQEKEILEPIRAQIMEIEGLSHVFYRDNYTPYWYLEVFSGQASKANGARLLKEYTGADRVVAFGDNYNDLPLFAFADECYAVSNAPADIRAQAGGVIGSHAENGVARYLSARWQQERR